MTQKHESVLSDAELSKALIDSGVVDDVCAYDLHIAQVAASAALAKLQPQLDAIGAGGVSGQPLMRNERDNLHNIIEKELLDIEMCFESFPDKKAAVDALIDWHVNAERGFSEKLRIVCSGVMPDLRFVEVENEKGESVSVGKWRSSDDGYIELVINSALPEPTSSGITSTFKYSCTTCNDSGIIGNSDVCPYCKDAWNRRE